MVDTFSATTRWRRRVRGGGCYATHLTEDDGDGEDAADVCVLGRIHSVVVVVA